MIALLDYRAGNLTSVRKALAAVGAEVFTPGRPAELARAHAVIVPGVGHFGATGVLDAPWRDAVRAAVHGGTPLLGICLGLQWLFEGSEEAPDLPGLGLLQGRCWRLGSSLAGTASRTTMQDAVGTGPGDGTDGRCTGEGRLKVPHVGWNALEQTRPSQLLAGVPDGAQAYFTHSYVAPVTAASVAVTVHGEPFASAVEEGWVFGAQFHPEKSGQVGLTMLRNFLAQR